MQYTYTEQINVIKEIISRLNARPGDEQPAMLNHQYLTDVLNDAGSTIAALNITKDLTCKAAEDLAKVNAPEFAIKNLVEYERTDLELLLRSVQSSYRQAKEWGRDGDAQNLDVWCYRIRDAIKLKE